MNLTCANNYQLLYGPVIFNPPSASLPSYIALREIPDII